LPDVLACFAAIAWHHFSLERRRGELVMGNGFAATNLGV
jgi:hypothetical protein